jgi:hypothetical protein
MHFVAVRHVLVRHRRRRGKTQKDMSRFMLVLSLSMTAASLAACSSSTETVTSPSPSKCGVSVTATPSSFQVDGGAGTLTITTSRDCEWSATAANGWIQLGEATTGQGNATLSFTVARNADPSVRKGTITVGSQQVELIQDAARCVFTIAPPAGVIGAVGGSGTHTVTASSQQCAWTARSEVDWMSIVDGAQGTGNGQVHYQARPNSGPARTGTLTIAGQAVVITQTPCVFTIDPASDSIGAGGGQRTLTVTGTSAQCSWTARSDVDWISVIDGAQGTGNGQVRYEARASSGPARSGTITVAGQPIVIAQANGCRYALQPGSQDVAQSGGTGRVAVSTSPGCTWTAASSSPWVVLSGSSGNGNGVFTFSVDANAMGVPARNASITVADQTFRVNQAAGPPCVYTLTGTIQLFPAVGAPWAFSVTTGAACAWTATPSAPWITITGPATGSGNGNVAFSVGPNPPGNPGRTGTITIGTSTFTVVQNPM